MKFTICGIEITEEHASRIIAATDRILNPRHPDEARLEAERFKAKFLEVRITNPHNTFKGTCSEYIQKYLPEKTYLIKYL